jgi:hypothetical protein
MKDKIVTRIMIPDMKKRRKRTWGRWPLEKLQRMKIFPNMIVLAVCKKQLPRK